VDKTKLRHETVWNRVGEAVQCEDMGRMGVRFPARAGNFIFATTSRPALESYEPVTTGSIHGDKVVPV
jgi:hypothetical protein